MGKPEDQKKYLQGMLIVGLVLVSIGLGFVCHQWLEAFRLLDPCGQVDCVYVGPDKVLEQLIDRAKDNSDNFNAVLGMFSVVVFVLAGAFGYSIWRAGEFADREISIRAEKFTNKFEKKRIPAAQEKISGTAQALNLGLARLVEVYLGAVQIANDQNLQTAESGATDELKRRLKQQKESLEQASLVIKIAPFLFSNIDEQVLAGAHDIIAYLKKEKEERETIDPYISTILKMALDSSDPAGNGRAQIQAALALTKQ